MPAVNCTEDCDTFTATKQHSSSAAACNDTSVNLTFKTNRAQPDDLEVGGPSIYYGLHLCVLATFRVV